MATAASQVYGFGRTLPATPQFSSPFSAPAQMSVGQPAPAAMSTGQPAAPAATPAATAFRSATSNLVRTGSLSGTPAPTSSAPAQKMATLVGADGTRKAVAVGSADAQNLFGQGYKLETAAPAAGAGATPTTPATPATSATTTPATPAATATTSYADKKAGLRKQLADLENEQFVRTTEYTPEELRNLTPGQQAELRRQRVTALSGQLGNITAALQTVKDEEDAAKSEQDKARTNALETLNTYLKYGVLDQLSAEEQKQLATDSGMNPAALKKINDAAAAGDPPELKEVGGNLYSLAYDTASGTWKSTLVQSKPVSSGGGASGTQQAFGGSNYPKDFVKWYETYVTPQYGSSGTVDAGGEQLPAGTAGPVKPSVHTTDPSYVSQNYQYWLNNVVKDKAQGKASASNADYADAIDDMNSGFSLADILGAYSDLPVSELTKLYDTYGTQ